MKQNRRLLVRLALATGVMTSGVVTFSLTESLGLAEALWRGLGSGAGAAGVFVLWFLWKEAKRRNSPPEEGSDNEYQSRRTYRRRR